MSRMGRHTDEQTLEFIKRLKDKGQALGYETVEEYSMLDGRYAGDLVWLLAKDQPPIITFEIETGDSLRVFKNTSKYFDTTAKDIPKPFRHFIIVIRGRLSEGTRIPLQRYINHYNISLFEDVAHDPEATRVLFEELDELKVQLKDLVARYLSSGNIDATLQGIITGIQRGMPPFFIKPKEVWVGFSSGKREDPSRPHVVSLSAATPEGEPTLLQRIHDAMRTGETIRLTKEDRVQMEIPGLGKIEPDYVELRSENLQGFPVELLTTNSQNSIELILVKESETEKHLVLSNAAQGVPYKFKFTVRKQDGSLAVSFDFDMSEADPFQAVRFLDFLQNAKKENRWLVRSVADEKTLLDGPFPVVFKAPSESEMRTLRILADIQQNTGTRLPMPSSISSEEAETISKLYQITKKGEVQLQMSSLTVSLTGEEAKFLLARTNGDIVIDNFQAKATQHTESLFGVTIPLGEASIIIPKARIDRKKLQSKFDGGIDPITVEVTVVPVHMATIQYENWIKRV